jgi:endonuclease/exonuclease/phosphatase family metal-dependent hydrolase
MKIPAAGLLAIRVLTHNIRFATTEPGEGERPWEERGPLLLNELKYNTLHDPESFICMQEVLDNQLRDIMSGLNGTSPSPYTDQGGYGQPGAGAEDGWASIGVGRNDGKSAGEYSPILFRPSVWDLDSFKTVWLSEKPDEPGSIGWDAGNPRIVTVGRFTHHESRRKVVAMCTHFDNQGEVARAESAKLVLKLVEEETRGGDVSIFLAGDLNSEPDGEAYKILNGKDGRLGDVEGQAKWKYGDRATFTGFKKESYDEKSAVLDFVFVGGGKWAVEGYSVLPNLFEDGVIFSDHRAVVADLAVSG